MAGARAANRLAQGGASIVMITPDLVNVSGLMDDAKCGAKRPGDAAADVAVGPCRFIIGAAARRGANAH